MLSCLAASNSGWQAAGLPANSARYRRWNSFHLAGSWQVQAARELIAESGPFTRKDLEGLLPVRSSVVRGVVEKLTRGRVSTETDVRFSFDVQRFD
jgi:hypothetical protein